MKKYNDGISEQTYPSLNDDNKPKEYTTSDYYTDFNPDLVNG